MRWPSCSPSSPGPCLTGSAAERRLHEVWAPEDTYYLIKSRAHDVCIGAHDAYQGQYVIIYIDCTDQNARFRRVPALGGYRYVLAAGGAKGRYLYGDDYAVHSSTSSEGTDRVWRVAPVG